MGAGPGRIAEPFPLPSPLVVDLFDQLRLASESPPKSTEKLRELASLPRPWDPAACPPYQRALVYAWLDAVAGWINEEHAWRVERMIPPCWVEHPHIVHELAAAACLRWESGYVASAAKLEEWHRLTLPTFLDRIAQRIGPSACPPGQHQPNPGTSRAHLYRCTESVDQRLAVRERDTESSDEGHN